MYLEMSGLLVYWLIILIFRWLFISKVVLYLMIMRFILLSIMDILW